MKRLFLSPKFLLIWGIVTLAVPNMVLAITERQSWLVALCNIILPTSLYLLLLTSTRRTGKAVWWAFPLTFLAAFQVVLLYLFGSGVIAVDMWLNLVTTNKAELSGVVAPLNEGDLGHLSPRGKDDAGTMRAGKQYVAYAGA